MATKKKAAKKKVFTKTKTAAIRKYDYPLSVAAEIEVFLNQLWLLEKQNTERLRRIYKHEDNDLIIGFAFIHAPDFFFVVNNEYVVGKKISFDVICCPASKSDTNEINTWQTVAGILSTFKKWLELLKQYEVISLTEQERLYRLSEKEFFDYFDIVDEDADTAPFDTEIQIQIYHLLEYMEKQVAENAQGADVSEIKSDIQELKSNLQDETKRGTVKKLSQLFAKIKKKGIRLILALFKEGKKEVIKRLINGGFDGAGRVISYFT